MSNLGDFVLGDTFDTKFTSRQISGAPFTLAGSPVVSAYVGNSTTQITAGITLTVDFDGVTGLNHLRVVASTGNGYATASNYQLTITAGTVNSVSVVGEVIKEFSIENRILNRAKLGADTGLQSIRSGTAQAGAASTITLDASASAVDDYYNSGSLLTTGGTGAGQFRIITDYVGATKVATVDAAWATNPDSTTTFAIFPAADSAADIAAAVLNATQASYTASGSVGERISRIPNAVAGATGGLFIAGTNAATTVTGSLTSTFTGNLTGSVASVTGAVGSVTGNVGGNVTGSVGSVTGAVGSVTGSVGSVTGNVSGNLTGSIGSLAVQAKTDVNNEMLDVLVTDTHAQPAAVPAATSSLRDKINWLFTLSLNKITQTATTQTLRNATDTADIATATVSDNGATGTREKFV